MATPTIRIPTREEIDVAEDVIRARLNEWVADAREAGAWVELQDLLDECDDWIRFHRVTPERAREIAESVRGSAEEEAVRLYLASVTASV